MKRKDRNKADIFHDDKNTINQMTMIRIENDWSIFAQVFNIFFLLNLYVCAQQRSSLACNQTRVKVNNYKNHLELKKVKNVLESNYSCKSKEKRVKDNFRVSIDWKIAHLLCFLGFCANVNNSFMTLYTRKSTISLQRN